MAMSLGEAHPTEYFGPNAKYVTRPTDGQKIRCHHRTAEWIAERYGWKVEDAPDLELMAPVTSTIVTVSGPARLVGVGLEREGIGHVQVVSATAKLERELERAKAQRDYHRRLLTVHQEGVENMNTFISHIEEEIRKAEA